MHARYAANVDQSNHRTRQIGALPLLLKPDGGFDLCLVTTRGGGRWIIPKGNPIAGLAPREVAAREAREEAGLIGQVGRSCIGSFALARRREGRDEICDIDVFALFVERRLERWAEAHERSVLRCDPARAVALVRLPGLAAIIEDYVGSLSARPLRRGAARFAQRG